MHYYVQRAATPDNIIQGNSLQRAVIFEEASVTTRNKKDVVRKSWHTVVSFRQF
jgi:hypothetical protein